MNLLTEKLKNGGLRLDNLEFICFESEIEEFKSGKNYTYMDIFRYIIRVNKCSKCNVTTDRITIDLYDCDNYDNFYSVSFYLDVEDVLCYVSQSLC